MLTMYSSASLSASKTSLTCCLCTLDVDLKRDEAQKSENKCNQSRKQANNHFLPTENGMKLLVFSRVPLAFKNLSGWKLSGSFQYFGLWCAAQKFARIIVPLGMWCPETVISSKALKNKGLIKILFLMPIIGKKNRPVAEQLLENKQNSNTLFFFFFLNDIQPTISWDSAGQQFSSAVFLE